jgi:hypothetical protein
MRMLLTVLLALLCWASAPQAQTTRIIYLATVQGDGTDANPFRSTGAGTVANQNCIDLRADSTVSTGRMLCAADSLPAGGGINQLASTFGDTVTAPRKAAIEAALGVTLTASNIIDVIAEVLTTHARLDGSRWKPLRSGRDGKYKIWLGGGAAAWQQTAWLWDEWRIRDNGLVADATNYGLEFLQPALAWATSISEDFNCADNASLTCDLTWTEFTGTEWAIASNQASVSGLTGVQQKEARADSSLAGDDHWAQATVAASTSDAGGTTRCGPIARKSNDGTRTFYAFHIGTVDNIITDSETRKRVAGTATTLVNDGTNLSAGDVLRVYVDGSSVSGYVNGVLHVGPTTDTDITGNTYAGIAYSSNSTITQSCTLDNFSAADITLEGGAARRRHAL